MTQERGRRSTGERRAVQQPRKRVLCVDDCGDMVAALELALADEYDVVTATDGEAAFAALEDGVVDAVVLDFAVPALDVRALVSGLRARDRPARVILVSGLPDVQRLAEDLGADESLRKPFDVGVLKERLTRLLGP